MSDDQKTASEPGSPSATTTISGKQLPPPDPKFGGVIKERASESNAVVAAARRAAEGRTQRAAHHDGRRRASARRAPLAASSLRPAMDRIAESGLRYTNFHSTALCSPSRAAIDHGTQPSLGRLRGGRRNRDGIPGLRLDHPDRQRHHRHNPEGERVRDLVVRQGPQHALLPVEPGRAVRSMAERHGLRLFLWLRRRRRQPVATEPVPQYDGHLSPSRAIPAGT